MTRYTQCWNNYELIPNFYALEHIQPKVAALAFGPNLWQTKRLLRNVQLDYQIDLKLKCYNILERHVIS